MKIDEITDAMQRVLSVGTGLQMTKTVICNALFSNYLDDRIIQPTRHGMPNGYLFC